MIVRIKEGLSGANVYKSSTEEVEAGGPGLEVILNYMMNLRLQEPRFLKRVVVVMKSVSERFFSIIDTGFHIIKKKVLCTNTVY